MKKKKGKNKKINENIDSSEDLEKEVSLNRNENYHSRNGTWIFNNSSSCVC